MKLETQIIRQKESGIKELGSFCAQYGYERLVPPSRKQKKIVKRKIWNTRKSFRKPYKKQNEYRDKKYKDNR